MCLLCVEQSEPAAALVHRAEPSLPAHQSRSRQPVSLPVPPAAETLPAQTHHSDGQILPIEQAGLELVRSVKGQRFSKDFW